MFYLYKRWIVIQPKLNCDLKCSFINWTIWGFATISPWLLTKGNATIFFVGWLEITHFLWCLERGTRFVRFDIYYNLRIWSPVCNVGEYLSRYGVEGLAVRKPAIISLMSSTHNSPQSYLCALREPGQPYPGYFTVKRWCFVVSENANGFQCLCRGMKRAAPISLYMWGIWVIYLMILRSISGKFPFQSRKGVFCKDVSQFSRSHDW